MTEVMSAIAVVEQDLEERPVSRASTASSSRLTREEVTLAGVDDLEDFCRQVFTLCDTNGDGYITQDVRLYQLQDFAYYKDTILDSFIVG